MSLNLKNQELLAIRVSEFVNAWPHRDLLTPLYESWTNAPSFSNRGAWEDAYFYADKTGALDNPAGWLQLPLQQRCQRINAVWEEFSPGWTS